MFGTEVRIVIVLLVCLGLAAGWLLWECKSGVLRPQRLDRGLLRPRRRALLRLHTPAPDAESRWRGAA